MQLSAEELRQIARSERIARMDELDALVRRCARAGAQPLGPIGESLADDIAQEVWMVLVRRAADIDPQRPLKPLLVGVSRRVGLALARRLFPLAEKRDGAKDFGIGGAAMDAAEIALSTQEKETPWGAPESAARLSSINTVFSETVDPSHAHDGGSGLPMHVTNPLVALVRREQAQEVQGALDEVLRLSFAAGDVPATQRRRRSQSEQEPEVPATMTRTEPNSAIVAYPAARPIESAAADEVGRKARSALRATRLPDVSEDLRSLRSVLHVTQAEMAKRLGVSAEKYCSCEYGRSKTLAAKLLPLAKELVAKESRLDSEVEMFASMSIEQIIDRWRSMPKPGEKVSLHELQAYIGVNKSTLSRWLSGQEIPKSTTLVSCETRIKATLERMDRLIQKRLQG